MALVDLPLDQLRTMTLAEPAPEGLASFWRSTIDQARRHELLVAREPVRTPLVSTLTHDLTFTGFDGQPVRAWLQVPASATTPLPTVVQFHGYATTRSLPLASSWVDAGFAHLQLDNRGQGWSSVSRHELTPDQGVDAGANSAAGLMTRGVLSPDTYYYRRLMTDAVRLVELARTLPEVDPDAVFVQGASQGGGLAIAAAGICAMTGTPVAGAMPDVAFLCSFRRGVDVAVAGPYPEIESWLQARPQDGERVFETLRWFDGVHLGAHAGCPALFSVALRDPVCPPSTVFQAYNAWGSRAGEVAEAVAKDIVVYPWNQHEGGCDLQLWRQLEWARAVVEARQPQG